MLTDSRRESREACICFETALADRGDLGRGGREGKGEGLRLCFRVDFFVKRPLFPRGEGDSEGGAPESRRPSAVVGRDVSHPVDVLLLKSSFIALPFLPSSLSASFNRGE